MGNITIKKVTTSKEMSLFAQFGNKLYKDNKYYVPDLEMDIKDTLNPKKNAAFEFSEAQAFLAYKGQEVAGRVVALINHRANERWNVRNVRFGWIDFIDDEEVSKALLNAVEQWGKERGMTECQGPMGFTDFDKEGMLIEGFEEIGSMATIYNYPYYPQHMERHGYGKEVDWVHIRVRVPEVTPEKYVRVADMATRRYNLHIKKLDAKAIFKDGYGQKVFDLLNEAYRPIFGYSELSQKQIDQFVKTYFKLIDLRLVTLIENAANELVGLGITMGSLSKALQKSGGKLLPFGWLPLLKSLKWKMEDTVDMLLIAVKPEFQGRGINALLFTDLIPIYNNVGFVFAETGPQLETNMKELSQWEYLNPTFPKRRRCYCKKL